MESTGGSTSFLSLPSSRCIEGDDKEDCNTLRRLASAEFNSAFPDAPASSSASRIPASSPGNSPQKASPSLGSGAPGWGNVFSWLRANAAAAEAQKVLSQAGMATTSSATFGRAPLVNKG